MKTVKIYALYHPITNEIRYIGKTVTFIKYRLSAHICEAKSGKSKSPKNSWIVSLLNKGLRPKIKLLDECNDESWIELEKYWIKNLKNLTNLSEGGDHGSLGVARSKEAIQKTIETMKLKIASGEIDYSERAKKISKTHTGKKLSEVTKEKIRQANLGKKYPIETIIKKSRGGILQFDKKTKKKVDEYLTLTEASAKTGFFRGNISSACTGRLKSYKGFIWKYKSK